MVLFPPVEPFAWLLCLPLAAIMLGARHVFPEHPLMQCWTELRRREEIAWFLMGLPPLASAESAVGRAAYWTLISALLLTSVLSLITWLT
jgi:hypothetical protein